MSIVVVNSPCVCSGSNYYVRILSTIDRELLKPNASVALHKHSNALVDVLPPEADSSIMMLTSGNDPNPLRNPAAFLHWKSFPVSCDGVTCHRVTCVCV